MGGSVVNNPPVNAGRRGLGRSLEEDMDHHSSIVPARNPTWTEGLAGYREISEEPPAKTGWDLGTNN